MAESRWKIDIQFIEQGDIYFFYKPKKGIERPSSLEDIARFFFVLDPDGPVPPRYIVMGNKKMPEFSDGGQTTWGFVQIVGGRGFRTFRDQVKASTKRSSRPAGEGIYAIVTHRDHTHLLYTLELPQRMGPVQEAFTIKKEANYILMHRPVGVFPKDRTIPFSNFSPVNDPTVLNEKGTQVLLVGVASDIGRLGISAEKDKETLESADIFSRLKVNVERHPIDPLITGNWE